MKNIQIKELAIRNITLLEINMLLLVSSIVLGNDSCQSLFIIFEFMIIRSVRNAYHYDKVLLCSFMTICLMFTIFVILKIDFRLAILITFIAGIGLSEKGKEQNLKVNQIIRKIVTEGFMFKPKGETKYDVIDEFIKNNCNTSRVEHFEKILKNCVDHLTYEIYLIRFYQRTEKGEIFPQDVIGEKVNLKRRRVIEKLDNILLCFEVFEKTEENKLIKK